MKIALVIDRFDRRLGGVEGWTATLASRLVGLGHEVHVAAWAFGPPDDDDAVVRVALPAASGRIERANAAAAILERGDYDIIHETGVGWYCDVLHPHNGAQAALVQANIELAPPLIRPFKRWAARWLPRYRAFASIADRQYRSQDGGRAPQIFAAVSQKVARDMIDHYGVRSDRIRVVSNGVDRSRFEGVRLEARRERTRRELRVADECVFLLVAHNLKLKGTATALRAVGRLRRQNQKVVLVVAGGRRLTPWRRLAARVGAADAVRFLGPVDDIVPYYAAADAVVTPTFYDSFGLTVLEGAACGLPVIVSRRAGASGLITDGLEGLLLDDPADDAALAQSMRHLLDPGVRESMKDHALALAARHDFDRNVQDVMAMYDEIMSRRQHRRAA